MLCIDANTVKDANCEVRKKNETIMFEMQKMFRTYIIIYHTVNRYRPTHAAFASVADVVRQSTSH